MGSSILLVANVVGIPVREAKAADWYLKALFSETTLYNNNRKLALVSAGHVFAALSTLTLDLGLKGRSYNINLTTRFSYPYYFGPGVLPSDNQFDVTFAGTASFERKIDTNTFSLSGSVVPVDTEISELTDSGKITLTATRWTYAWQAGVSRDIDDLNTISLSVSNKMVRFTGDDSAEFTPFDSMSVSGSWQRRLTKRTDFMATLGVVRSEFGDPAMTTVRGLVPASASTTYSAKVGLSSKLTKRLSFDGSVGMRATEKDGVGTTYGRTWNVGFDYTLKRSQFTIKASRSVAESSRGDVRDTTTVGLSMNRKITRKLSMGASYNVFSSTTRDRNLLGVTAVYAINSLSTLSLAANHNMLFSTDGDRQLLTLSAAYARRLTEDVQAELKYVFKHNDATAGVSTSHAVFLTVSRPFDIFR